MTTDSERLSQRARQRAYRRLAEAYPAEFDRLFLEEKQALGIKIYRRRGQDPGWCRHCDLDPIVYSDEGLCRTCKLYEYRTGQRPSGSVLARRIRRREMERWSA